MSRRSGARDLSNEEILIAYGELEKEMNELRNIIGREQVEDRRTEAYGNLEPRAAKLADAAERIRERRYGGARIIEVAPIKEAATNATNATVNATSTTECRTANVSHKECRDEAHTTEASRVKVKSIKKEKTSESKKIKPEEVAKTEVSGNDAETLSKEKKKIKTKARQPSTSTESSEEEEEAPARHKSRRKEEEEKNHKKNIKEKSRRDQVKRKKRCKLEFSTDESREDECAKKISKRRTEREDDSLSDTSSDEDSTSDTSTRKSSKKEKHKDAKHFKKWLVLEKFDGTTPLSIFLNQLETCAKYNGWDSDDKASHLRVSLKGNAAYIMDDENLEGASCRKLVKRLKSRFGTEGQSSLYHSQLRTRRRGKDEALQTLYHDINRMAGLAYPRKSSIHRELTSIDAFIDALNDSNLRMRVRDKEPKNLDHALHIALLAEANTESKLNAAQDDPTTRGKKYKARGVQNTSNVNNGASNVSVESKNNRCDKICEMLETI